MALAYEMRKQFYFSYHSLVLYSFGLENALERSKMDISFFLTNVYESATVSTLNCICLSEIALIATAEMLHDRQGPFLAERVLAVPAG